MTLETFIRIIFAILAFILAIILIRDLATGRAGFGNRIVQRAADPRRYWGAVGMNVIFLLTALLVATLPAARHSSPIVFIGLFGGQLFGMLVTGTVHLGGDRAWTRADDPRPYWKWVLFHAALVAAFTFFLIFGSARAA